MSRILLLTITFFFNSTFSFSQTTWELLNPKPSFHTGLDIHFVTNNKGYLLTEGNIVETSDAGLTWEKKQDIESAFDFSFLDNLGIIVGKDGYVMKTIDSGETWTEFNIGLEVDLNTVSIIDENSIIISARNNLFKSFDGGDTWENLPITNGNVNRTFFEKAEVGHAACDYGTILKTVNGGLDWYKTDSTSIFPSDYFTINFKTENIGFATREHTTTMKTEDGGETWTEISGITSINQPIYTINFVTANIGFAGSNYGRILKTTDGGDTWNSINTQGGILDYASIFGLYFIDENFGFATGQRGRILRTIDGGQTWTGYALTYNDIKQIEFPTSQIGIALAKENIFKTTDGGYTWETATFPTDPMQIKKITFYDQYRGYAIVDSKVYRTTNGGTVWGTTNGDNPIGSGNLNSIHFVSQNVGFVSGGSFSEPGVYKTISGGSSWEKIAEYSFDHMQFISETYGYGKKPNSSEIYKTNDGGNTWGVVYNFNFDINAFHFLNLNEAYLVGDNFVSKTTNGGVTWTDLDLPNGDYTELRFVNDEVGYVSDEYGKIYKTEDGGQTWEYLIQFSTIKDITIIDDNVYVAGTHGKLLVADIGLISETKNIEKNDFQISISPNPTKEFVNIELIDNGKIKSISLIDLSGKIIQTSNPSTNSKIIRFDLPETTNGIYFIKIILEDGSLASRKLIIE